MKTQRVNPSNMNHMELNNMSNMMSMMNIMQRIGKGKRKISIKLDKGNKKFLSKFIDEVRKQFTSQDMAMQNPAMTKFFDYIQSITSNKNATELRLSFEEYEFLKKMLIDSIRGMDNMEFKWYQFIKKSMLKVIKKQYRELLKQFK